VCVLHAHADYITRGMHSTKCCMVSVSDSLQKKMMNFNFHKNSGRADLVTRDSCNCI